jgi:hypothetical protein
MESYKFSPWICKSISPLGGSTLTIVGLTPFWEEVTGKILTFKNLSSYI